MADEEQDEQFYRDTESIAFPKLNDHLHHARSPNGSRSALEVDLICGQKTSVGREKCRTRGARGRRLVDAWRGRFHTPG